MTDSFPPTGSSYICCEICMALIEYFTTDGCPRTCAREGCKAKWAELSLQEKETIVEASGEALDRLGHEFSLRRGEETDVEFRETIMNRVWRET